MLVDELVRGGVEHAVLCPGSRNAPLSFALAAAAGLTLHVRIDERTAGFLALGLALRSGRPVPVVCTSGTAAANLHPAVLEADHAGVPLVVVTADRPPELIGTGANQTVRQHGLYGAAVRRADTLGIAERRAGQNARWRSSVARALAAATREPGPVHLNVPLREPLVPVTDPDGVEPDWPEPLHGRPDGAPWTMVAPARVDAEPVELDLSRPTVVVAGHGARVPDALAVLPVLAEPTARCPVEPLLAGPWLAEQLPPGLRPEQVVVVGRPTLHRGVQRLLADAHGAAVTVLTDRPEWTDVAGIANAVASAVRPFGQLPAGWTEAWRRADDNARRAVRSTLDAEPFTSGLRAVREVLASVDGLLVVGSSNPIRDVGLVATPAPLVLANRGAGGIDGTVSTAVGAALAHGAPATALLGDLTFLHDATGLVLGPDEPRPDLAIVVLNDDGGGLFNLLEQGAPAHAEHFERIFGTPHGVDLAALCAATHTPHTLAAGPDELRAGLAGRGLRVVEVRVDRSRRREVHDRVRRAVRATLQTPPV